MDKKERIYEFRDLIDDFDRSFPDSNVFSLIAENRKLMNFLADEGFFEAPASTKYHGSYEGGLYDHSKAVYKRLRKLTVMNDLHWKRPESPFIVGMFHDLCKYDQYRLVKGPRFIETNGNKVDITPTQESHYEYNDKTLLKGHGSKSVLLLAQFVTLTDEEILCIRYHMGAYEKEEWNELDQAIRKYETVLWTHHADMLASKVDDI